MADDRGYTESVARPISENAYEEKVKKGMKRDPEIENMFREQAERPAQDAYNKSKNTKG